MTLMGRKARESSLGRGFMFSIVLHLKTRNYCHNMPFSNICYAHRAQVVSKYVKCLKLALGIAFGSLLFSSCSTTYGVANIHTSSTYSANLGHADTTSVVKEATYLSGTISSNIQDDAYNDNEFSKFGTLTVHRSITQKTHHLSYGGFGFLGTYKVNNESTAPGNKSLHGMGVFGAANLRVGKRRKFLDFGPRLALMYEGGEYHKFRRDYSEIDDFRNQHPQLFSAHLGAQMTFNFKFGNVKSGTFIYYGGIFGGQGLTPIFSQGVFASYKQYMLIADVSTIPLNYAISSLSFSYRFGKN